MLQDRNRIAEVQLELPALAAKGVEPLAPAVEALARREAPGQADGLGGAVVLDPHLKGRDVDGQAERQLAGLLAKARRVGKAR